MNNSKMKYQAVFLDRDGTVNEEINYLNKVEQLKLIEGAAEGIRMLREAGYKVVIVTNQAAIARGYLAEADLPLIHAALENMLAERGAALDAIYYCPHHPTAGVGAYKIDCECRKPKPGMLRKAAADLDIDLQASYVVGDKLSDLGAGEAVGCRTILVRSGYGREVEQGLAENARPDFIADDLAGAARWILSQRRN